jgi:hypothetical protein
MGALCSKLAPWTTANFHAANDFLFRYQANGQCSI